MTLYGGNVVVCMFAIILLMNFGWSLYILLEVILIPLIIYTMSGSGYERSSAVLWILVMSYIVGIVVVCGWGVGSSLILIVVLIANVPLYGLHGWLPKLHVESSLFGSMILASVVLNFALVPLYWMIGLSIMPIVILCALSLLNGVDGNWVIAISSVVHITAGTVLLLFPLYLMWGGVSHFIVSPILFYIIYVGYLSSGSRYLVGSSNISVLLILLINLSFPLLGSFYMELPLMLTFYGIVMFCVNGIWFLKLRVGVSIVKLEYLLMFMVVLYIL